MATQPISHLHSFLSRLTKRSVLSSREQSEILNLPTRLVDVRQYKDFVRPGEITDHAWVVLDGLVGGFDQNHQGGRQITALHVPGDIADLHSVVHPGASSALQALTPVSLATIPHAALRRAAANFPGIAEAFWRDCAVDAAILAKWVSNLGCLNAKTRLAHLIGEMACRYGVAPAAGQIRFALPMTQVQLADATGLTPIHVNRVLKYLREHGLTTRYRSVRIEDWQTFVAVAEFDGAYLDAQVQPDNRLRIVN